jgi:hypothetical protein
MEEIKDIIPHPLNGRILIELIKQEPKSQLFGAEEPINNLGKVIKVSSKEEEPSIGMIVQFNTGVPPVKLANSESIVSIRLVDVFHIYYTK